MGVQDASELFIIFSLKKTNILISVDLCCYVVLYIFVSRLWPSLEVPLVPETLRRKYYCNVDVHLEQGLDGDHVEFAVQISTAERKSWRSLKWDTDTVEGYLRRPVFTQRRTTSGQFPLKNPSYFQDLLPTTLQVASRYSLVVQ